MRTWWVGVVSNCVRCVKGSRARKTGPQVGEGEEPELGLFVTSVCVRNKCVAEGCCALLTSSGFIFFPHPPPNTATTSVPITFLNPPNHRQDLHRPPRLLLSQFLPLLYLQENSPENSEAWRFDLLKEEFPFVSLVSPSWS
ncbi:unnamed protein product [Musa banksii]